MTNEGVVDLVGENFLGLLFTVCSKHAEDAVEEGSASVMSSVWLHSSLNCLYIWFCMLESNLQCQLKFLLKIMQDLTHKERIEGT